jgi:hypothetical protein
MVFWCCWLSFSSLNAQKQDSTLISRHRPGFMWFFDGVRPSKLVDARKYDRFIVDVNYASWVSKEQHPIQPFWNSIGYSIQSIFDIPFTAKNTVGLGVGLGYEHTRIHSDQMLQYYPSSNSTILNNIPLNSGIEKYLFTTNKLFIPLEIRFRTSGWQFVKFQVGGRIGYQLLPKSHYFTTTENGLKEESIQAGFKNINPWIVSLHARIGIRNWAITTSYNLSSFFVKNQSTPLNGLQIGLSISLF